MEQIFGKVHSIETCGTLDGPGIRFVVFMQGCNLRCQYCHNPDTWNTAGGTTYTAKDLLKEVVKYESYMRFSNGGITITGGEPLLQIDFLIELFMLCRELGLHTALDTSGSIFNDKTKILLEWTDLVILDIKSFDNDQYLALTGVNLQPTIDFVNYANTIQKKIWVRYVLVPNLTDDLVSIANLSKFLGTLEHVERIEVLPFHKMGEYKWEALNLPYTLQNTKIPTEGELLKVLEVFYRYNRNVIIV